MSPRAKPTAAARRKSARLAARAAGMMLIAQDILEGAQYLADGLGALDKARAHLRRALALLLPEPKPEPVKKE